MTWFSGLIGKDASSKAIVDSTFFALATSPRALPHGAFGHYRVTHRVVLVATQAANSRLFSLRNIGANLIIPTRLMIKWVTASAHTAFIEDSIDCTRVTGFTVQDTTNTVTPAASRKRTAMATSPGNVEIRGLTATGVAAGMTGGTLSKDGSPFYQLPMILPQAVEAVTETTPRFPLIGDALDDVNGTHPFVFANNEGLIIENRVLLGAAAGSSVYIDLCFAELPAAGY